MHYYLHNGAPLAGSYLYTMKRRHNYHHFVHHDQGNECKLLLREIAIDISNYFLQDLELPANCGIKYLKRI